MEQESVCLKLSGNGHKFRNNMEEKDETINNCNPMAHVALLSSVMYIKCPKCNIEYPANEKCPKCGSYGGFAIFKSGDCTNCAYFTTHQFSYPSGKCTKHNILVGIKEYCADFKIR